MIAGGFTCQRYGFNVGADKFSLLTIENGKNKHYAPIGMDIDFPKPKISLRQAASEVKTILEETGWEESFNTFQGNPIFMTLHFQELYYPKIKSRIDAMPAIKKIADISADDPDVQLLAWHLHRSLFLTGKATYSHQLPLPEKKFGEYAGVFFLMIAISAIPLIEKTTQRLGLPEKYAEDSATWLGGTVSIFAAAHKGLPGHDIRQTPWLKHTIDGELFRIGRLEFWAKTLPSYVPAIYRDTKGNVIRADIGRGTTIEDVGMREKAKAAARKNRFNEISGVNNQSGTITYVYKLN